MKTAGIILSALATTVLLFLGKERDPHYYLAWPRPGFFSA